METISVKFHEISAVDAATGQKAYHKYVSYNTNHGIEYQIHGGGSTAVDNPATAMIWDQLSGHPFGDVQAKTVIRRFWNMPRHRHLKRLAKNAFW
ncbi:MAG: hypothetical protein ABJ327_25965 [Litoreibacter sp.]